MFNPLPVVRRTRCVATKAPGIAARDRYGSRVFGEQDIGSRLRTPQRDNIALIRQHIHDIGPDGVVWARRLRGGV
ncbi:hypothetical protein [Nocardia neocaledoniensis]|uniref:hypothetical protein n=1 Tax=Nocardia neocaledoniensis TaxID=236511 RepID=UPI00245641F9|nr:hypothetical protein [Nocardia neocaledoniensis]